MAIEHYHKALSLRPQGSLVVDMLSRALEEDCEFFTDDRLQAEFLV